nr:GAP family protein [Rhodococcus sp. HNM0569]
MLVALLGFAFLDSLDVLLVGVTVAVVYDARAARRSAVPRALAFLGGVFVSTTTFGILTVLGLGFLSDWFGFTLTDATRYRGELAIGVVLVVLALLPSGSRTPPEWATRMRSKPWVLAAAGAVIGIVQAPTAVPYLAGLALLSTQRPVLWPLIVVVYCALALIPPVLVLVLSTRRTRGAVRRYLAVVRVFTRYGPRAVRVIFFVIGALLVVDALVHHTAVW